MLSFLDPEKRRALRELDNSPPIEVEEAGTEGSNPQLDPVQALVDKQRKLRDEQRKNILTADEWEEYQLRTSPAAAWLGRLAGLEFTPEEGRELARLKMEHGADMAEFERRVRALLGEERMDAFRRAGNTTFAAAYDIAFQSGLPETVADSIYQARRDAENYVLGVRVDASLSQEDQVSEISNLQTRMKDLVLQQLGQKGWEKLTASDGDWIENLVRVRP